MINPPYEKVLLAYHLREAGLSLREVAAACGAGLQTVAVWLKHPEKYAPYLDEIAIMRAREGEDEVYDNLTIWEKARVPRND